VPGGGWRVEGLKFRSQGAIVAICSWTGVAAVPRTCRWSSGMHCHARYCVCRCGWACIVGDAGGGGGHVRWQHRLRDDAVGVRAGGRSGARSVEADGAYRRECGEARRATQEGWRGAGAAGLLCHHAPGRDSQSNARRAGVARWRVACWLAPVGGERGAMKEVAAVRRVKLRKVHGAHR